jgi:DNA polymerase-3 subunit delta'
MPETRFLPWQSPLLEHALELERNGRLPHAVLIDNASQQDSSPLILHLATLLLCDQPDGLAPCGACEACRMMQAGTYADFSLVGLEIDEKSKKLYKNIKIEQVRDLIHELSLTHQYQRLKIAAIYPAEAMSKAGANALLKTLEEPADGVLILLVTHNRGQVPVTLRSRCQHWRLDLPERADALDWLRLQGLDDDELERYLDYAGGDAELALELESQGYATRVDQFKQQLGAFLRGELSVTRLGQDLAGFDPATLRLLIGMTLGAYCYRDCGVDTAARTLEGGDRRRAQQLLDLRLRAQKQLLAEQNNLDLRLQLEDVLISMKQILTRRSI